MTECKTDNSCHTDNIHHGNKGSCSEYNHKSDCCTMAEDILGLAKCAKHELLKEKMKIILEKKMGKKLDKVAEVTVDAMLAYMTNIAAEKEACRDYETKLHAAFKE
ncbi:hypothetical protein N9W34_00050 [Rickettsiales bacterium]|nr:hypothetical protein [Rickettsiales bacterium]